MQSAERTLDAPELVDDYYLNLLDWYVQCPASSKNAHKFSVVEFRSFFPCC
jgi:hypothetical protein